MLFRSIRPSNVRVYQFHHPGRNYFAGAAKVKTFSFPANRTTQSRAFPVTFRLPVLLKVYISNPYSPRAYEVFYQSPVSGFPVNDLGLFGLSPTRRGHRIQFNKSNPHTRHECSALVDWEWKPGTYRTHSYQYHCRGYSG